MGQHPTGTCQANDAKSEGVTYWAIHLGKLSINHSAQGKSNNKQPTRRDTNKTKRSTYTDQLFPTNVTVGGSGGGIGRGSSWNKNGVGMYARNSMTTSRRDCSSSSTRRRRNSWRGAASPSQYQPWQGARHNREGGIKERESAGANLIGAFVGTSRVLIVRVNVYCEGGRGILAPQGFRTRWSRGRRKAREEKYLGRGLRTCVGEGRAKLLSSDTSVSLVIIVAINSNANGYY